MAAAKEAANIPGLNKLVNEGEMKAGEDPAVEAIPSEGGAETFRRNDESGDAMRLKPGGVTTAGGRRGRGGGAGAKE